jgi:hypothetical protein
LEQTRLDRSGDRLDYRIRRVFPRAGILALVENAHLFRNRFWFNFYFSGLYKALTPQRYFAIRPQDTQNILKVA